MHLEMLPEAETDAIEASVWYGMQQRGLNDKFESAIHTVLNRLLAFPESGKIMFQEYRTALVSGFPYTVVYKVERDRLAIHAVWQAEQDPQALLNRLSSADDE